MPLSMLLSAFWFLLANMFFYLAIKKPPGYSRYFWGVLHVLSVIRSTIRDCFIPSPYSEIWVLFVITATLRSFNTLFIEKKVIPLTQEKFNDDLREIFWIWSNFRHIPFTKRIGGSVIPDTNSCTSTTRGFFGVKKLFRTMILWLVDYLITRLAVTSILGLGITIEDFGPDKQGLVPHMISKDVILRMIMSFHWIFSNYFITNMAYDLFSVFFISILRWDMPSDWPPLFGSVTESYSLRRFWGGFWHKLHIQIILAYTPSTFFSKQGEHWWQRSIKNSLKAFWIFLFSGTCHGLANLSLQKGMAREDIQFFLCNYIICLAEVVVKSVIRRFTPDAGLNIWLRLLGYVWVLLFFFCTVPAWKYPLVYNSVMNNM